MVRVASFDPSDRLPWLSDPAPQAAPRPRRSWPLLLLALAAGGAGAAGWTVLQRVVAPGPAPSQIGSAETVRLPPPRSAKPAVEAPPAPVSDREALTPPAAPSTRLAAPTPRPETRVRAATPRIKVPVRRIPKANSTAPAQVAPSETRTGTPAYDARAWNSGVQGRIIQLGAFRTPAQANGEWNRVYYRYPLLRPLSPRVVRTNIRGSTYYRLQLGTFSHAHSELLCQRLRAIGQGCIVLGLNKRGRRG